MLLGASRLDNRVARNVADPHLEECGFARGRVERCVQPARRREKRTKKKEQKSRGHSLHCRFVSVTCTRPMAAVHGHESAATQHRKHAAHEKEKEEEARSATRHPHATGALFKANCTSRLKN